MYKGRLLAVLWYLNIITFDEYVSRSLHDWEISNEYLGQQETRDSRVVEAPDETGSDREGGVEDNTELD